MEKEKISWYYQADTLHRSIYCSYCFK